MASQLNYKFAVFRAWESVGNYDYTGIQNIKNARQAKGILDVDAYIFPRCSGGASAAAQVEATINKLRSEGATIGMLWLDIERYAWPANQGSNQNFILEMVHQGEAMGVKMGVYTNYNNWMAITGINWAGVSHLPLWYAAYDGQANFNDFRSFGGWSKPSIKQYSGKLRDYRTSSCGGLDIDQNWY
uniref:Glycosyl hydrolase family 25 n=1 Tax=Rhabditophanes sp. KR3021 TaxID=114890 RepID=A0AC35TUY5_9BILA